MCANGDSIRDIMLGAEEIGILDTGQYVFINMGKTFSNSSIFDFKMAFTFAESDRSF